MEGTVKERIMDFINHEGLSKQKFERETGLSSGYISKLKYQPKADMLGKILHAFPDLNEDWLLTGKGSMLKGEETEEGVTEEKDGESLPLIPITAMAGALSGTSQTFMEYDCERYVIPAFSGAEFIIRVQGDSMTPKYNSGDLVACKRVPLDRLFFQWGKAYVIDTSQGALLKRIEPSDKEGHIYIYSENEKYKPFQLPTEEIFGVAVVVGVIRVE